MRISILSVLAFGLAAQAIDVRYDAGYDRPARSLDAVACSNGDNGLETRYGFEVQSDVPNFPNVGAAFRVSGWNDVDCGSCYTISYQDRSLNLTAIDAASEGFVISLKAMNRLTNGRAVELGRIDATSKRVALQYCGF